MKTSKEFTYDLNELHHNVETAIARLVKKNNLENVVFDFSFHRFTINPKVGFVEIKVVDGNTYNMLDILSVNESIMLLELIEKQINN